MKVTDSIFDRSAVVDFELVVCGYEQRSTYVARSARTKPTRRVAIDYGAEGVGSYDLNREWLDSEGAVLLPVEDAVVELLAAVAAGRSVRVDISSMRRESMARIFEALYAAESASDVEIVYAPAAFEQSSLAAVSGHALTAGPITPELSGAVRPTSIPLAVIAGLGLEEHRVLGLTELLEPVRLWAFIAKSDDPRFAEMAAHVNRISLADTRTNLMHYEVRSLANAFAALESLVFAAGQSYRLVLAPSGPKIFTLACILSALPNNQFRPAVWRVGDNGDASGVDVQAAGDVVSAQLSLRSGRDHASHERLKSVVPRTIDPNDTDPAITGESSEERSP